MKLKNCCLCFAEAQIVAVEWIRLYDMIYIIIFLKEDRITGFSEEVVLESHSEDTMKRTGVSPEQAGGVGALWPGPCA